MGLKSSTNLCPPQALEKHLSHQQQPGRPSCPCALSVPADLLMPTTAPLHRPGKGSLQRSVSAMTTQPGSGQQKSGQSALHHASPTHSTHSMPRMVLSMRDPWLGRTPAKEAKTGAGATRAGGNGRGRALINRWPNQPETKGVYPTVTS